jgi:hypothetical protein
MILFKLIKNNEKIGEGVQFENGSVVVRMMNSTSIIIWDNIKDAEKEYKNIEIKYTDMDLMEKLKKYFLKE